MEKKVKLSQKQLETISSCQAQRAKTNEVLQIINDKETLVLQLVMEANGIESAKGVKLEEGFLVFELEEEKPKKNKKVKELEKAE
jgi:uncharacterized protein (DUF2249 family)